MVTLPPVSRKRPLTRKGAEKLGDRERAAGLEQDDAAAQWLEEHDPPPKPPPPKAAPPKAAGKSKLLHQWRQRQQGRESTRVTKAVKYR